MAQEEWRMASSYGVDVSLSISYDPVSLFHILTKFPNNPNISSVALSNQNFCVWYITLKLN